MIFEFEDDCWSHADPAWRMALSEVLVVLGMHSQHAVLASQTEMLRWCETYLPTHREYFPTRLSAAQPRANALRIKVSPQGSTQATGDPPWTLCAPAARDLAVRPLRLVFENDQSDQTFAEATVPSLSQWRTRGWIEPAMGGGSTMLADIGNTAANPVARWRTFYLFDSDRLHPDELNAGWTPPGGDGCQGYQFEAACASMPSRRWHRLMRRSIENYLPPMVLSSINSAAASVLSSNSVGQMANFYNMKHGLRGDGVSPPHPPQAIRSARSQGFWTALSPADIHSLEDGFGRRVWDRFSGIPAAFAWPADVMNEMTTFAAALQDAM